MAGIIDTIFTILIFAIVARSILSFIVPMMGGRPHPVLISINTLVIQVTDAEEDSLVGKGEAELH